MGDNWVLENHTYAILVSQSDRDEYHHSEALTTSTSSAHDEGVLALASHRHLRRKLDRGSSGACVSRGSGGDSWQYAERAEVA